MVNAIYEMKNYPVVLLNTVLAPLSFLTLIWFVSKGTLLIPAIIGGLIMTMFSSGTSLQGDLSHLKNDFKLQDMVVSSPTSASTYVLGIAISELIYSLPPILILSTLFYFFVPVTIFQLIGIVVVLIFVFITSVSLGFALSHDLLGHRAELRFHTAADDTLLHAGAGLLPDNLHPDALPIPSLSFSYHLCGADSAELERHIGLVNRRTGHRLGSADQPDRVVPYGLACPSPGGGRNDASGRVQYFSVRFPQIEGAFTIGIVCRRRSGTR